MFANDHDVDTWVRSYTEPSFYIDDPAAEIPNLRRATLIVERLRDWANANSDGWVYWKKPQAAAQKMIALLADADTRARAGDDSDCSAADVKTAMTPIKTMLTKHGADWHEVFEQVTA